VPSVSKSQWLSLADAKLLDAHVSDTSAVRLFLQVLRWAAEEGGPDSLANRALAEFCRWSGASGAAIASAPANWKSSHEFGAGANLSAIRSLPGPFLSDVLDRAAGALRVGENSTPSIAAAPLERRGTSGELLIAAVPARQATTDLLQQTVAFAHYLGLALGQVRRRQEQAGRIGRLEAVLRIAVEWNATHEVEPLLLRIAQEATRLLEADRASIFIWDRANRELVGRPALGVEGGELRVPDDEGIVGQVVQTGQNRRVEHAYESDEFSEQVDTRLGYRTRNLLCVPLLDAVGDRIGAFEVLNKRHGSFSDADEQTLVELAAHAAIALENARERERLVRVNRQMTDHEAAGARLIGDSPAIAALRGTVERVASTDLPVLILGESGAGKEVVSRAIHFGGKRRHEPFMPVNCAALTESLLESELFGHERGAFTDARETRQGKFELASGGTLFLDEIGDMSPGGQAKLLRVLEEKVVYRVGGSQPIRIDVRVIAATNRKLADAVRAGKFRQDLFYRLSVVTLDLPPLRERPEDILPLARYFLEAFSRDARRKPPELSPEAVRRLQTHAWPGNVRELKNLMERLAFLCPHDRIEGDDLAFTLAPSKGDEAGGVPLDRPLAHATDVFQQDYIQRAIRRSGGNMTDAAKLLGLHRSNLYRKMRQLGMETEGRVGE
jgi:Nif-specific regulatory protein